MRIYNFKKMKGGWFIGNFFPTAFKTKNFEVSYKLHKKMKDGHTIIIKNLLKLT